MPQGRCQVQCVVVLTTSRAFTLIKYLGASYGLFFVHGDTVAIQLTNGAVCAATFAETFCKARQICRRPVSMPQGRCQVRCVVMLATSSLFTSTMYLKGSDSFVCFYFADSIAVLLKKRSICVYIFVKPFCKVRQTCHKQVSMPQGRCQVRCVVVLATRITFTLLGYL